MSVVVLLWLVIGAVLIVAEIMTGTFYLFILGVAAWVGAVATFAHLGLDYQIGIAGLTAVIGLLGVRHVKRRRPREAAGSNDLDVGNEVTIEAVEGARLKVQYRGAIWDAVPTGTTSGVSIGDRGVICGVQGSVLVIQVTPR